MATYIIGDVHGCLHPLHQLLEKIELSPQDRLFFTGDLINRGPHSLEVLNVIMRLPNAQVVLGNHDLHLLAIAYGSTDARPSESMQTVLLSPQKRNIIEWMRHQPLLRTINPQCILVHAGLPPQWDIPTASQHANTVEKLLQSHQIKRFLDALYQHEQVIDASHSSPQYTTLSLTQIRRCTRLGDLELKYHKSKQTQDLLRPWFEWYDQPEMIVFGHWAALRGKSKHPHCIATDTGCVWGGQLSAYHLEAGTFIRVDST